MSNLIPFSFESRQIRAFSIDGNPWFVGKDVAEALGYKNPTDAITRHCKGVAKHYPLQTAGGTQEVRILNEPDTFRLIVGSNLPEAQRFEQWLFEEVLPSIRKTGSYTLPGAQSSDQLALQLAELLRGKVLVDQDRLRELIQGMRAMTDALSHTVGEIETRTIRPTAPTDPWESRVHAFVSDRIEVTITLVLDALEIPAAERTQTAKNHIARILKKLGFINIVVNRGGRTRRVWQRRH